MADATNVEIGVCSVTFNSVDLGHTKEGATVSYEPDWHEITVDQYGGTPVDVSLVSERLTVTVTLAEYSIDNLEVAIPAGTGDANKITVGKDAGDKYKSGSAAELTLHPIKNASDDYSEDIVFHKAIVINQIEVPYLIDGERVFEVEFLALIDENQSEGNYLGLIGDSTA